MSGPGARAERALGGCRRQAPASRGSSHKRTCSAVSWEVLLHDWR
jgi:hypothetical protein